MSDRNTTYAYNWMPTTSQTTIDAHETATGERLSDTNINPHNDPVHVSSVLEHVTTDIECVRYLNSLDPTRLDSPLAAPHRPADAPSSVTHSYEGYPGEWVAPWDDFNTAATATPHSENAFDFAFDATVGNNLDLDFNNPNSPSGFNYFNDWNNSNNFNELKESDFGFEFDFSVHPAGTSGDFAQDPFAPILGDPTFGPVAIAAPPITAAAPVRPRHHCAQCQKSFTRTSDLTRHQRSHSPNSRRYACPFPNCSRVGNRAFLRSDKLMDHRRRMGH